MYLFLGIPHFPTEILCRFLPSHPSHIARNICKRLDVAAFTVLLVSTVKVRFSLEQANMAQMGSTGLSLIFH
jgi:hypothetical protein